MLLERSSVVVLRRGVSSYLLLSGSLPAESVCLGVVPLPGTGGFQEAHRVFFGDV